MEESVKRLSDDAEAQGLLIRPLALYGNDVNFRTPLVDIYEENLLALQALKAGIDPENVMNLAGGFKFKFSMLRYPCILHQQIVESLLILIIGTHPRQGLITDYN